MSVSDILLDKNLSNQGIFDAQLHSLQVYKTPTLPTDVITLQHSASAGFNVFEYSTAGFFSITQPGCYVLDALCSFILPEITPALSGAEFIFILRGLGGVAIKSANPPATDTIFLGINGLLIGANEYAPGVFLPNINGNESINLRAVYVPVGNNIWIAQQ
jgi:hypothetical protein